MAYFKNIAYMTDLSGKNIIYAYARSKKVSYPLDLAHMIVIKVRKSATRVLKIYKMHAKNAKYTAKDY